MNLCEGEGVAVVGYLCEGEGVAVSYPYDKVLLPPPPL